MKKRYLSLLLVTTVLLLSLVFPFFYTKPIVLGHYRGDIVRLRLDGCIYVLETADDRFELVDYNSGEKEDVIVYYSLVISRGSVCMVGPMIRVLFSIPYRI